MSAAAVTNLVAALRHLKREAGVARSFEHQAVTFAVVAVTILSSLKRLGIASLAAIVGDATSPAVIEIRVEDLVALLREVGHRRATVTLATDSADGLLVADLPDPAQGESDLLLSGTGTLTAVLDDFVIALPGGHEFSGN